jgi:hypothetical protein
MSSRHLLVHSMSRPWVFANTIARIQQLQVRKAVEVVSLTMNGPSRGITKVVTFLYLGCVQLYGLLPSFARFTLSSGGEYENSSRTSSALLYQSYQSTKGPLQDYARSTNRWPRCAINGWLQPKVDAAVPQTRACTKALRLDR